MLVDQGTSTKIIYWDAFERLCLYLDDLKAFHCLLVGFSSEHVKLKGYITLKAMFGNKVRVRCWCKA